MKWFRFWTDTVNDVKMLQLSDYEYRMWTYLLSYASEVNSLSGQLQITFKLLSLHFHQRFNLFSRAIETFQKVGLVTVSDEGFITITNWNKRQFKSDDSYSRVKKYREVTAKRNVSMTVSETAPDTDTDTDTDKRKKKKENVTIEIPLWINPETWDDFTEMRKSKKEPITAISAKRIIAKLNKLRELRQDPNEILDESIANGWKGVFPLKGGNDGNRSGNYRGSGAPYPQTGRGQDDRSRGLGIPKEYKPEHLQPISEEDRERNLERVKSIIDG